MNSTDPKKLALIDRFGHLNYISSLSQSRVHFNPKDLAITAVTAFLTTAAQVKNLRRSHNIQGELKKVQIDQTFEGYANFISPGRMNQIAYDAEHAQAEYDVELKKEKAMTQAQRDANTKIREFKAKRVWGPEVLQPANETYLSAAWDEMVPFPTSKSSHHKQCLHWSTSGQPPHFAILYHRY